VNAANSRAVIRIDGFGSTVRIKGSSAMGSSATRSQEQPVRTQGTGGGRLAPFELGLTRAHSLAKPSSSFSSRSEKAHRGGRDFQDSNDRRIVRIETDDEDGANPEAAGTAGRRGDRTRVDGKLRLMALKAGSEQTSRVLMRTPSSGRGNQWRRSRPFRVAEESESRGGGVDGFAARTTSHLGLSRRLDRVKTARSAVRGFVSVGYESSWRISDLDIVCGNIVVPQPALILGKQPRASSREMRKSMGDHAPGTDIDATVCGQSMASHNLVQRLR